MLARISSLQRTNRTYIFKRPQQRFVEDVTNLINFCYFPSPSLLIYFCSPPDQPIPFHHELAQTANPPEYVFFFCDHPSSEGGQTPLIDSTAVYRYAQENHPEFISKLQQHGARYIRTLPTEDDPTSPIGRSYKSAYNVNSKEELEDKLASLQGSSCCTWLNDGSVRIMTPAVPAIRLVADHAENYVFQYTFSNSIIAAYLGWQDVRNDRHDALRFGNMDPMDEDVLESIAGFMERERVLYSWKKGDIIAINNMRKSVLSSLCIRSTVTHNSY
jgi:hypothetical protein